MDINKVTLMGHVGQEPTFHKMANSDLAKFSMATSRKWKDKATGEKKEETSWHNIVVFNPYLVDVVRNWIQKGSRVYIEGELKTRSYDKEGVKKYITEIIIPQVKGELFVIEKGKGWDTNETPGAERKRGSGSNAPQRFEDDDIPF
jgi:single-strand DNA-binding protein